VGSVTIADANRGVPDPEFVVFDTGVVDVTSDVGCTDTCTVVVPLAVALTVVVVVSVVNGAVVILIPNASADVVSGTSLAHPRSSILSAMASIHVCG
jgi:hypothetical protein